MKRFIEWWQTRTANEKLMYALIVMLAIGILTRIDFIKKELGETFDSYIERMKIDSTDNK